MSDSGGGGAVGCMGGAVGPQRVVWEHWDEGGRWGHGGLWGGRWGGHGDTGDVGVWEYGTIWGGGGDTGMWLLRAVPPPTPPYCHCCPQGGGYVAPGLPHLGALQRTPPPSQRPPQLRQGKVGGGGTSFTWGPPQDFPWALGTPLQGYLRHRWVSSSLRPPHPTAVFPPHPSDPPPLPETPSISIPPPQ